MDLETVKIEGLYRGCCKFCLFCLIALLEGLRVGGIWRVGFCKHFIQKGQLTFPRGCRFHEHLFNVFPHVVVLAHPYQQNSEKIFSEPY